MKNRTQWIGLGLVLFSGLVLTSLGQANAAEIYTFDGQNVNIEYWTGSGANEAVTVIDFGDDSFAFGYRWESAAQPAHSWDMLNALDLASDDLTVISTDWGGTLGIAINSITYKEQLIDSNWTETFLGFWVSDDGLAWTDPGQGVSGRVIGDGSWDGYSKELVSNGFSAITPPNTPLDVPEPMTLALLGAGSLLIRWRRA